ncbi:thiamine pyrophosphate-binding protein [Streptomyces sp. NPDC051183]|uniref:thiamine pyrophosphate-binding protein n=1 Tax=Streptomyces sp. NPDC051183 TaxID=3155165 RepID=UPI003421816B
MDRLVSELAGLGVGHVFGVGGANIEDLYDALHAARGSVRGVVAKHEFSAAAMADAYARVTGRLGVVAATSSGGAMNLVPGLAESYASRVPVLALVGQPETGLEGRGAFQDGSGRAGSLDAGRVFAAVSRFCARAGSPNALAELLPRALTAARTDPAGPAVLLLPKDVQRAPAGRTAWPRPADPPAATADPAALDRALACLRAAAGVLVIAGAGVLAASARDELAALARRLGAWVAVTPDAKDAFDNHDPRYAGVAGVMGHPGVESRLRRTDVCLLVGTRLPHLARAGLEEALADTSVISFGPEPPFVRAISVPGDLCSVLRDLLDGLEPSDRPCPSHPDPQGQCPDRPGRPRTAGAAHAGAARPGVDLHHTVGLLPDGISWTNGPDTPRDGVATVFATLLVPMFVYLFVKVQVIPRRLTSSDRTLVAVTLAGLACIGFMAFSAMTRPVVFDAENPGRLAVFMLGLALVRSSSKRRKRRHTKETDLGRRCLNQLFRLRTVQGTSAALNFTPGPPSGACTAPPSPACRRTSPNWWRSSWLWWARSRMNWTRRATGASSCVSTSWTGWPLRHRHARSSARSRRSSAYRGSIACCPWPRTSARGSYAGACPTAIRRTAPSTTSCTSGR